MTAPNTTPRFTKLANMGFANVDAANTANDGGGNLGTPTIYKIFTAGAQGSYVDFVRIILTSSAAATTSNATVIRIYWSTVGSGATSTTDTHLMFEYALAATTVDSATVANPWYDLAMGLPMPTGTFLHATSHAAAATNTHNLVMAFGGDY